MIISFPGAITAQLNKVGGKGQSLIRMTQLGLPVPPGFVLTVDFFQEWMDELKLSEEWTSFVNSSADNRKSCCDALKSRAQKLKFSKDQKGALDQALSSLDENELFAVRSSSPAEDLEGSSFAGGYETVLGVKRKDMLSAVRTAFSSSMDYRVLSYKSQHGFDIHDPRIAVVVQKQLNSTASGVAFSINPINNDYDEAVFNANFGLGESVVSGVCTPDTIVVDKVSMRVREKVLGAKEERIFLNEQGGTTSVSGNGEDNDFAISDGHVLSLTRFIKTLEEVFRKPVDVEWALEGDQEFILQARPVTSFVPLPPSLISPPGQTRKLYLDVSLTVQALEKPMSIMGTSVIRKLLSIFPNRAFGVEFIGDLDHSLVYPTDGRIYAVLSHVFQLLGKERVENALTIIDPLSAQAIKELDDDSYDNFHLWVNLIPLKAAPGLVRILPKLINARAFPERVHARSVKELERYKEAVRKEAKSTGNISQVAERIINLAVDVVSNHTMPGFLASRVALERIKHTARGVSEETIRNLELAMPHNITIEMGLSLYQLAQQLPPNSGGDVQDQTLSPEFMAEWQEFLDANGHRGPRELDIQAPRYRDAASLLFDQVVTLNKASTESNNPSLRYKKNRELREKAFSDICDYLGKTDAKRLRRFKFLYRAWLTFGGYRETHKFCIIYAIDALRTRLIDEANKLVSEGRLDSSNQIFDLTIEDFEKRVSNKKIDLVELGQQNRVYADKLAKVPQLPPLIDSRGRIVRPKTIAAHDGQVAGTPISSGIARGPIKVLNTPDEKPLNYGDILVARATDPGWTPLFVNASAVILEVGGLLQHGALVAREYGLPCVGGITGATTIWKDGTIVEVDGTRGTVREIE
ncbi:MAG: hypothetical protein K2X93_19955 [Candidatus Obscuribacterales bacterium]|nr:hypothetical protein [Candidatus Obscuribacterales bacterium]